METPKLSSKSPKSAGAAKRRAPRVRPVDPPAITGAESPRELLEGFFPAYVGRGLREAHRLMRTSIEEDHVVFATLSGAMTPAGMHQSCVLPMIERGFIQCLTTTGANVYHDLHRTLGHRIHEVNPAGDDGAYRRERIIRIYDLGRVVAKIEDERKLPRPSLLATCFRHGVPIFVGAPQDGSIYLNVVKLERA